MESGLRPAFFIVRFGQAAPLVYYVAILNVWSSPTWSTLYMAFRATHFWTAVGIFLLIVLQYRLWFDDSGVIANRALERQIDQLQTSNDKQSAENHALLNQVMDLRTGDALLEETAREELGLVKDGETFILFAEPDS
ncbi:MAG: hypothetical protein CMI04_03405 [Oceanospirillaceae bacterium]|nr:hypothetical protein [Oceanospirillaceae bacterium]|tara:strand:- start:10862 stop:11272 length:411 start_codon:yes stop_codon:yes gene_type:complete